jgi:hypothetical protein
LSVRLRTGIFANPEKNGRAAHSKPPTSVSYSDVHP